MGWGLVTHRKFEMRQVGSRHCGGVNWAAGVWDGDVVSHGSLLEPGYDAMVGLVVGGAV